MAEPKPIKDEEKVIQILQVWSEGIMVLTSGGRIFFRVQKGYEWEEIDGPLFSGPPDKELKHIKHAIHARTNE